MHNGDAPHTAIAFGQILANKGIAMLPWSSTSLDLNLIDVGWTGKKIEGPAAPACNPWPEACPWSGVDGHTTGAGAVADIVNKEAMWRCHGCWRRPQCILTFDKNKLKHLAHYFCQLALICVYIKKAVFSKSLFVLSLSVKTLQNHCDS